MLGDSIRAYNYKNIYLGYFVGNFWLQHTLVYLVNKDTQVLGDSLKLCVVMNAKLASILSCPH